MEKILLSNGEFCDKLEVHKNGDQHFAFSVFMFNENGEMLIQKRAKSKYHSGGLWSNSCCSHFRSVEEFYNKEKVAINRLREELGDFVISTNDYKNIKHLKFVCQFDYCDDVGNNLIENEQDFIFAGICSKEYYKYMNDCFNKNEVEEVKFIKIDDFLFDIRNNCERYTKWLYKIVTEGIFKNILEVKSNIL